jgi:hypothetical protein
MMASALMSGLISAGALKAANITARLVNTAVRWRACSLIFQRTVFGRRARTVVALAEGAPCPSPLPGSTSNSITCNMLQSGCNMLHVATRC